VKKAKEGRSNPEEEEKKRLFLSDGLMSIKCDWMKTTPLMRTSVAANCTLEEADI